MDVLIRLDAATLKEVVTTYQRALREHRDALNRLNVYPVPDGDTGTNMALTLDSVVAELAGAEDIEAVCHGMSHGSLMGARGNSGVIMSQILRGVASVCGRAGDVDGRALAVALTTAADAAYQAVMRPVEGTILTVARAAGEAAAEAAASSSSTLCEVLDAARDAAGTALDHTPDLLPVLAEAGVVDAGGAGFLLFVDAFLNVVAGRPIPPPPGPSDPARALLTGGRDLSSSRDGTPHGDVSDLRYEVMFFLEAPDETMPRFREVWAAIGDSIVVVGGDGLHNCHIHTDDIGAAIEAALDVGRPRKIRVTDLMEEVEEERWVREASEEGAPAPETPQEVGCAVVAVATGDGVRRIFRSLHVQQIVAGGQSMNPSTAQMLDAVEAAPAAEVVVLPNNRNIVAVAEQVNGLTDKTVTVVPTRSVAEGFAALTMYDPQAGAETNAKTMAAAAGQVVSGELTRAVRDSRTPAGFVHEGDYLGVGNGEILVVRPDLVEAAGALLGELVDDEHEIVTIIEGDGATAANTRRISEWLAEHRPDVEVEQLHGGQPLYPYIFSIE